MVQQTSVARKIFVNIGSEIFNKIAPLVTIFYVPRTLGIEQFGRAQFAINLIEMAIPLILYGYWSSGSIAIARARDDAKAVATIVSSIFALRSVHSVVVCFGLWLAVSYHSSYREYAPIVSVLLLCLFLVPFDMLHVGTGVQQLHRLNIVQSLIRFCSLIGILIFVRDAGDAVLYSLLYLGANTVFNLYSTAFSLKRYPLVKPKWTVMRELFKNASLLAPIFVLTAGLERFDIPVTEYFFGAHGAGLYAAPARLAHSLNQLALAVSVIFFSELMAVRDPAQFSRHVHNAILALLAVIGPVCAGIWFVDSHLLVALFGAEFADMGFAVSSMVLGTGFNSLFFVLGLQVLVLKAEYGKLAMLLFSAIAVGAVVAWFLQSRLGLTGIAIGSVVAKFFAFVLAAIVAAKYLEPLSIMEITRSLVPALLMAALLRFLKLDNAWANIPVGGLFYCAVYWLLNQSRIHQLLGALGKLSGKA